MKSMLRMLLMVAPAVWPAAAFPGEPARAMPHRFLFTSLGWLTSQGNQDYYPNEIPDQLVVDWADYAEFMQEVGFNAIGPWGFLCNAFPYPWGVDTRSTGSDTVRISSDKLRKARAIVEACHKRKIAFYYGHCLYFAYYTDFLSAHPEARTPNNPSVFCPLFDGDAARGVPGSIELMKQAIDFVVDALPTIDGVALESYHHGRCTCDRCLQRFPDNPRGTAEFHRHVNVPVLRHIRERHPQLKILFCPEGPLEVIQRSENLDILTETLRLVDYFVWCGAIQPADVMKKLQEASPATGLMFRQEPWQSVPPQASDRDGWFFPNLVNPLGRTIRERSGVIPWAGVAGCGNGRHNPSNHVNLRFLARMQMDPARDPEQVAREILQEVYRPLDSQVLEELYKVWSEPELKFRELWSTWFMHIRFMPTEYKFSAAQAVEMVNAYQTALARLRAIMEKVESGEEAARLETSIVKWIGYIKNRLREDYDYDMP